MNLKSRIYDPSIGRFLSVDPLWEMFVNQSPYSYALNNPISYKDPSGLAPEKEKGGKG
jgi:RHS repeat-associated protein